MKKIAILGPGLLGASLAKAIRARRQAGCVAMWARREAAAEEARAAAIADLVSTDLETVVSGADLVVLCIPVEGMPALTTQMLPYLKEGALVTDVGSVKGEVVARLVPLFAVPGQKGRFIGSHPMAGSEQSGLAASREDLFEGSVCIVTPHEGAAEEDLAAIARFWEGVGCRVERLSPEEHDRAVGMVSHLPHWVAAVLVDYVAHRKPEALAFCGRGFRDTTRIASGPAEMWTGIFAANRAVLIEELERFAEYFKTLSKDLAAGNDSQVLAFLTRAKAGRDRLKPKA